AGRLMHFTTAIGYLWTRGVRKLSHTTALLYKQQHYVGWQAVATRSISLLAARDSYMLVKQHYNSVRDTRAVFLDTIRFDGDSNSRPVGFRLILLLNGCSSLIFICFAPFAFEIPFRNSTNRDKQEEHQQ